MADKFLGFLGDLVKPAGGGGGNYVYYSGTMRDFAEGVAMASIIKAKADSAIIFAPIGMAFESLDSNDMIGAGFDTSMKMTSFDDSSELTTIGDVIAEHSKNWTQITEEEFYNTYVFSLEGSLYNFEEGMTWGEWVNSGYSRGEFSIDGEYIEAPNGRVHNQDGSPVKDSDLISDNENYVCIAVPA